MHQTTPLPARGRGASSAIANAVRAIKSARPRSSARGTSAVVRRHGAALSRRALSQSPVLGQSASISLPLARRRAVLRHGGRLARAATRTSTFVGSTLGDGRGLPPSSTRRASTTPRPGSRWSLPHHGHRHGLLNGALGDLPAWCPTFMPRSPRCSSARPCARHDRRQEHRLARQGAHHELLHHRETNGWGFTNQVIIFLAITLVAPSCWRHTRWCYERYATGRKPASVPSWPHRDQRGAAPRLVISALCAPIAGIMNVSASNAPTAFAGFVRAHRHRLGIVVRPPASVAVAAASSARARLDLHRADHKVLREGGRSPASI